MELAMLFVVLPSLLATGSGYYLDTSCEPHLEMIVEGMKSAFDLAQAGSDTLSALSSPSPRFDFTWRAQRDLLTYLFAEALQKINYTDFSRVNYMPSSTMEWQKISHTFKQVLRYNENEGQPSPAPEDLDSLGPQHLVLFCNFDRFIEVKVPSQRRTDGLVWNTATSVFVQINDDWRSCKYGTKPNVCSPVTQLKYIS